MMKKKYALVFYTVFVFLVIWGVPAWGVSPNPDVSNLQKQVPAETFKPGMGKPVGKALSAFGSVVVHGTETMCYRVEKDTPLFKGDTLITDDQGRLELIFADASRLSIAPGTTLVVNDFLFDNRGRQRSCFLSLPMGKARFWVKKLLEFRRSAFRVKTRTSIAGVRGSDFIVWVGVQFTEVIALEQTTLAIVSLVNPDANPVILTDFERIRETLGAPISKPEKLSPAVIRGLKAELPFMEPPALGVLPDLSSFNGKKGDIDGLIPETALVPPDRYARPESNKAMDLLISGPGDALNDEQRQIIQIKHESFLSEKEWQLPDFPAPP